MTVESFNPCIIIPVYNHQAFVAETVANLIPYSYRIFLVDDGSDYECENLLISLADKYEGKVDLSRLDVNEGKGGAVMKGFERAFKQGFTHALQIDADGQHDINDIVRFVEHAKNNPEAIIAGKPLYDETVPKGRLYGRYITHFWVWVETLSLDIKDSMCGFRVYPLAPTMELISKVNIAKRMDFDIEIIVRLYWQGLAIKTLETKVIYPDNGVSHFDMLVDNIRISKTHSYLFLGMLKRLPVLLCRK